MSKVNFKDWPVVESCEFEMVQIDATKWNDGGYTALFNLYKTCAEKPGEKNTGMTVCSQLHGETLLELYQKVNTLIQMGFFGDSYIDAHGDVYDQDHNEIGEICWMSFHEDGDDIEGLEDRIITHSLVLH